MYPLEDEELSEVFIQSIKRTCIILMHYLVYECCLNKFNEQSECHSIKIELSPVNFTSVWLQSGDRRRGRRPKVDPAMLDPMKLTGEENVSVVNRVTGKRVGYMFKISTIKINLLKMLEITFLMFFFYHLWPILMFLPSWFFCNNSSFSILTLQITGAKAPPIRYLSEWLEQNPQYDIDPKWTDIVKSKVRVYIIGISQHPFK